MTTARAIFIGAALLAAACSADSTAPTNPSVGTKNVSIQDTAFAPGTVKPDANGHVVWTWNDGGVEHNVTFEDPITGSGDKTTGTFTGTFTVPGTYRFRCTHHSTDFGSGMHGTVVVGVAAPPDTGGGGYGY